MVLALLLAALSFSQENWTKLTGSSSIKESRTVVARNAQEWAKLWKEHKGDSLATPPAADFNGEIVIAVFLGERPTSGYAVDVETREDPLDRNRLVVFYKEVEPKNSQPRAQMVTRPFVMLKAAPVTLVSFEEDRPQKALPKEKLQGGLTVDQLERLRQQQEALKRFTFHK